MQENNKFELQLQNTTNPASTVNQAVAVSLHQTPSHMTMHHTSGQTATNVTTVTLPTLYTTQQTAQLSWTCELCGKMLPNREEWSLHAKSHLEVC